MIHKNTGLSRSQVLEILHNVGGIQMQKLPKEYDPMVGPKYALTRRITGRQMGNNTDLDPQIIGKAMDDIYAFLAKRGNQLHRADPVTYITLIATVSQLNQILIKTFALLGNSDNQAN